MPLLRRRSAENIRKKVEDKLYLATERPDDIFDLSECGMKEIPEGSFSLVRSLLKTHLLLQHNNLQDISSGGDITNLKRLVVLDLSWNNLDKFPEPICQLSALQVLNLSYNRLQYLPSSILALQSLSVLNLENNLIKFVPSELGRLSELAKLCLAGNLISKLPDEVAHLHKLTDLTLPVERMEYPPKDVCEKGTSEILRYLGQDDVNPHTYPNVSESNKAGIDYLDRAYPDLSKLSLSSMNSTSRTQELYHGLEELDRVNAELASRASEARRCLLGQLAEDENRLHAQLVTLQSEREQNHAKLVSSLQSAEESADQLIHQLLTRSLANRLRELEDDRSTQKLLDQPNTGFKLRREEILAAMQNTLSATTEAFERHAIERKAAQRQALADEDTTDTSVRRVLANRHKEQIRLASDIAHAEEVQKEAFAKLQTQQDSQAQRLRYDIGRIEHELCQLTQAELGRKAKREQINQAYLNEKRRDLIKLLAQLKKEQEIRQSELAKRLNEMERNRIMDQADYWLMQYQRLLDNKPTWLSAALDPAVYEVLELSNALVYTTNFVRQRVSYDMLISMTEEDLIEIGVSSVHIRKQILQTLNQRMFSSKLSDLKLKVDSTEVDRLTLPSAPPLAPDRPSVSTTIPSAPTQDLTARFETECCICQNSQCEVIFLQCGHVCTCNQCSLQVNSCPLCRATIVQRVLLQSS